MGLFSRKKRMIEKEINKDEKSFEMEEKEDEKLERKEDMNFSLLSKEMLEEDRILRRLATLEQKKYTIVNFVAKIKGHITKLRNIIKKQSNKIKNLLKRTNQMILKGQASLYFDKHVKNAFRDAVNTIEQEIRENERIIETEIKENDARLVKLNELMQFLKEQEKEINNYKRFIIEQQKAIRSIISEIKKQIQLEIEELKQEKAAARKEALELGLAR